MNKKLIFTDLDGTLLDSNKKISKKSEEIIKSLSEQGHYFCFCTGRSLDDVSHYYKQLNLKTLCVCNNGAAIYNPSDKHFDNIYFPINNEVFFKIFDDPSIQDLLEYFVIKTKRHTFFNKIPTETKIRERISTIFHIDFSKRKKEILIYTNKERKNNILSMILILKQGVDPHNLYYLIKKITNNLLISHWSIDNHGYHHDGQQIIELNHNFANKLNALKFAQSYYDILWADTIVFGDGQNDIAMLQKIDNSWSMINSGPHAITVGRNITKYDNNHDGVALTLAELLLPIK